MPYVAFYVNDEIYTDYIQYKDKLKEKLIETLKIEIENFKKGD